MAFEVGVKTDVGRRRSNNEDAFYTNQQNGIFIIADGMGGHEAGEVASRMAVEEIRKFIEGYASNDINSELLREAVKNANRAIYLHAINGPSLSNMGTTVVVAIFIREKLLLAHVGDSRAYLITPEGLKRVTDDHSIIFQMIKRGQISEKEALVHPSRGVLLRALGVERVVDVDTLEINYQDESLFLCTDGLTDMLMDEEVEKVLLDIPDPQEACDLLVKMANEKGGMDNITVILVKKKD